MFLGVFTCVRVFVCVKCKSNEQIFLLFLFEKDLTKGRSD